MTATRPDRTRFGRPLDLAMLGIFAGEGWTADEYRVEQPFYPAFHR